MKVIIVLLAVFILGVLGSSMTLPINTLPTWDICKNGYVIVFSLQLFHCHLVVYSLCKCIVRRAGRCTAVRQFVVIKATVLPPLLFTHHYIVYFTHLEYQFICLLSGDIFSCTGHGSCQNGACVCTGGYTGTDCSIPPGNLSSSSQDNENV